MKSRFDFNSVSEVTGVFVTLAAITVAVLIIMTARVQRWFEPVYEVTIQLPSEPHSNTDGGSENDFSAGAEALHDAEVLIAATTVGKVRDINIDDATGLATAVLEIQGEIVMDLRVDATARIFMPFLAFLGQKPTIKIAKGTRGGAALFPQGVYEATLRLPATSETDLQEQLRDWDDIAHQWNEKAIKWEGYFEAWNTRAIDWEGKIDNWNTLALKWEQRFGITYAKLDVELDEPNGKFYVFITNLNLLLDHLANEGLLQWATRDPVWNEKTKDLMDGVQRGTDETVELVKLFRALADGNQPLPPPFDETFAKLPQLAEQVNQLLARVEGIVSQVELASNSLPAIADSIESDMQTLPGFLIESQETLRQIEIMVRALQRHWLLRGYVDRRADQGRIPVEDVIGPMGSNQ